MGFEKCKHTIFVCFIFKLLSPFFFIGSIYKRLIFKFWFGGELKYTLWLQNEERHQTSKFENKPCKRQNNY